MMNSAPLHAPLFALLSSIYLCEPTPENLENWRQMLRDEPLEEAQELKTALDALDLSSEQELEDLLWEYTRLFIGPHRLPCPPLESVYTSAKRLMMQDAYDEVRECYARLGVEVGNENTMPDHIGNELNFLALILAKLADGQTEQNQLKALHDEFLSKHLRNWVPRFAKDLEDASETRFYQALAKITNKALA